MRAVVFTDVSSFEPVDKIIPDPNVKTQREIAWWWWSHVDHCNSSLYDPKLCVNARPLSEKEQKELIPVFDDFILAFDYARAPLLDYEVPCTIFGPP